MGNFCQHIETGVMFILLLVLALFGLGLAFDVISNILRRLLS